MPAQHHPITDSSSSKPEATTTVTFHDTGFAAVDAYFQKSDAKQSATTTTQGRNASSSHPPPQSLRNDRLGVGSSSSRTQRLVSSRTASSSSTNDDLLQRRLLNVGRKRKRELEQLEGEEVDDNNDDADDNDDEEDLGRTAIAVEKETHVIGDDRMLSSLMLEGDDEAMIKKKRKKGKKERQREVVSSDNAVDETDVNQDADSPAAAKNPIENGAVEAFSDSKKDSSEHNQQKKKKFKKKKRSRQKNIAKDHRPDEAKPSHLLLGRGGHYQGRPLTIQTKTKLFPPRSTSSNDDDAPPRDDWKEEWGGDNRGVPAASSVNQEKDGTKVSDSSTPEAKQHADVSAVSQEGINKSATSSRRRKASKPKYKNLVIS